MPENQQKQEHNKFLGKQLQKCSEELRSDESLSDGVKERINSINLLMVQIFLDPKDIDTHNVVPYIRYLINKFELNGYFSEFDILIESYTIAIKKTKEGYIIEKLPSWFKGTAFRIVSNLKRESKKQDLMKNMLIKEQPTSKDLDYREAHCAEVQSILKALENLSEEDRYLLNLRIVQGLTWQDISERMISEGREECSSKTSLVQLHARLRKRCERALKRLRNRYMGQK